MSIPKNSHPTLRGWVHPRTGELLKAQRMTQEQIDAWWHGQHAVVEAPAPAPMQTLHEAPSVERAVTHEEVVHHSAPMHHVPEVADEEE